MAIPGLPGLWDLPEDPPGPLQGAGDPSRTPRRGLFYINPSRRGPVPVPGSGIPAPGREALPSSGGGVPGWSPRPVQGRRDRSA